MKRLILAIALAATVLTTSACQTMGAGTTLPQDKIAEGIARVDEGLTLASIATNSAVIFRIIKPEDAARINSLIVSVRASLDLVREALATGDRIKAEALLEQATRDAAKVSKVTAPIAEPVLTIVAPPVISPPGA